MKVTFISIFSSQIGLVFPLSCMKAVLLIRCEDLCKGPIVESWGWAWRDPLVSVTALTGWVVHPVWLQGHAAAPLCHETNWAVPTQQHLCKLHNIIHILFDLICMYVMWYALSCLHSQFVLYASREFRIWVLAFPWDAEHILPGGRCVWHANTLDRMNRWMWGVLQNVLQLLTALQSFSFVSCLFLCLLHHPHTVWM